MTKSMAHNRDLCAAFIAKSKVFSRYPRVSEQVETIALNTASLPPRAYNPSILMAEGGLWMTYRYHFAGDARTRLGIGLVLPSGEVTRSQDLPIEGFSVEDARLFKYQMEPWISWVESKWTGRLIDPKAVVKFAKLVLPHNDNPVLRKWQIGPEYQLKASGNDWSSIQKNWCFFEGPKETLLCFYRMLPEQIVFNVSGDAYISQWNTEPMRWPYGEIRGGTILSYEGKLLRFFHSSRSYAPGIIEHRYYIGAALLESKPPFKTIAVSSKPIIYGSETDSLKTAERKACHHFKPNVVFPCGAIKDRNGWLLSIGVNDCACALVKITPEQLNL